MIHNRQHNRQSTTTVDDKIFPSSFSRLFPFPFLFHQFLLDRYSTERSRQFFSTAMSDITTMLIFLNIFFLSLIFITSFIHCIPVISNRRFQHANNLLILNLCVTSNCCCFYWIGYYLTLHYAPENLFQDSTCNWVFYFQTMAACQVIYSFSIISLHRYFYIVHHTNRYFKSKQWLRLSIGVQWVVGFIVPLPIFARHLPVSAKYLFSSSR